MSAAGYELSDTWVLASRSVKRIARQPDLAVGFTIQPINFPTKNCFCFPRPSAISTAREVCSGI
jgi:hypothetical protein